MNEARYFSEDGKTMNLETLFEGLRQTTKRQAFSLVEKYGHLEAARLLGYDTRSYDNLEAAGRLVMYDRQLKGPQTIAEYVEGMKHRLSDDVASWMLKNAKPLETAWKRHLKNDFIGQDFFSASTIDRSYLARPHADLEPYETLQLLHLRVATELYRKDGVDKVLAIYDNMSNSFYTHASPTLFNAGFKKPQMASCFLTEIDDNLPSILGGVYQSGIISSGCGGLGVYVGHIRHADIAGAGKSQGLIQMLQVYDALIRYADQRGKRRGAMACFCRVHHIDIEDFVRSVLFPEGTSDYCHNPNLNIGLMLSDIFMERVIADGKWTLFDPSRTPDLNEIWGEKFTKAYIQYEELAKKYDDEFKVVDGQYQELKKAIEHTVQEDKDLHEKFSAVRTKWMEISKKRIGYKIIRAQDLYQLILNVQLQRGMPYMIHETPVNFCSNQKQLGMIHCTNLCTEIMEKSTSDRIASCNLASISLPKFVKNTRFGEAWFDFAHLGTIVREVVRNLNKVIDNNWYPLDEKGRGTGPISSLNFEQRPLGIGVSGFANTLALLDLPYEDQRTFDLNDKIFACIYYNALLESWQLAKKDKIVCKYEGSPLSQGLFHFDLVNQLVKNTGRGKLFTPIEPSSWGQKQVYDEQVSWQGLRTKLVTDGYANSLLVALMPTATSSQMLGNAESCEPYTENICSRRLMNGNYIVLNRYLVKDLEFLGLWKEETLEFLTMKRGSIAEIENWVRNHPEIYPDLTENQLDRLSFLVKKYKTIWEISQKNCLIPLNARRCRYVDQAASFNLWLANPEMKALYASHLFIWKNYPEIKTGMYYLRQQPVVDPIKFTVDKEIMSVVKNEEKIIEKKEEVLACTRDNPNCLMCQS